MTDWTERNRKRAAEKNFAGWRRLLKVAGLLSVLGWCAAYVVLDLLTPVIVWAYEAMEMAFFV